MVSPVKASPMKVLPVKTDQKEPIPDSLEEDMEIDADVLGDALMSQLNVVSSPAKQSPTKLHSQHSAASYSAFQTKAAKSPVKSAIDHSQLLKGLTFVHTGEFDSISKDNLEKILLTFGGRVTSAVSKQTSYVIAGRILPDNRPVQDSKKYKEAESKHITIFRENELESFISAKMGDPSYTLSGKPKKPAVGKVSPVKTPVAVGATSTEMWTDLY